MMQALAVVVPVQHELRAMVGDDFLKRAGVVEAAQRQRAAAVRRMVQQHDAREPFGLRLFQQRGEFGELFAPQPAGGDEGRGWNRRREADQRDPVAPAQIGKALPPVVTAGPRREGLRQKLHRAGNIGVVIAGRKTHLLRPAEAREPRARLRNFGRQPNVDNIAGHRDMIRLLRLKIVDERREQRHVVLARAFMQPIGVAGRPLAEKFGKARARNGADMRVGKMGEEKAQSASRPPDEHAGRKHDRAAEHDLEDRMWSGSSG